ncbi:MAG: hypothetical protein QOC71_2036 [Thermoplasmata archaeon]|nr:hypothetical protein [Thermoplasmata archaeon]
MRKSHPVSRVGLSIRQAVKEQPGIHFRGLARAANVTSAGQLRHHLDRLEHQGVLVEVEDGRYKRFFVAGDQDPKLRAEMARFARAVPRRIAKLLLVSPMNRTELRHSLGCADSTLGYHLTRMVLLGDLARVRGPSSCLYSLTRAETVRKMLTQGPSEAMADAPSSTTTPGDDEVPNPLRPHPPLPADLPFPDREASDDVADLDAGQRYSTPFLGPGPGAADGPEPDDDGADDGADDGEPGL